jgi:hypothetical protein
VARIDVVITELEELKKACTEESFSERQEHEWSAAERGGGDEDKLQRQIGVVRAIGALFEDSD